VGRIKGRVDVKRMQGRDMVTKAHLLLRGPARLNVKATADYFLAGLFPGRFLRGDRRPTRISGFPGEELRLDLCPQRSDLSKKTLAEFSRHHFFNNIAEFAGETLSGGDVSFLRDVIGEIERRLKPLPDPRMAYLVDFLCRREQQWRKAVEKIRDRKPQMFQALCHDKIAARKFGRRFIPTLPQVMRFLERKGLKTRRSQVQRLLVYLEVTPRSGQPGRRKASG